MVQPNEPDTNFPKILGHFQEVVYLRPQITNQKQINMKRNRLFVAMAAIIGFASLSMAQVKSNSVFTTGKTDAFSQEQLIPAQTKGTQMMITHSTSQTVGTGTVACVDQTTGFTAINHYVRIYDLLPEFSINDPFHISSIAFGVENASSGTGAGQPVSVKLYTLTGAIAFANMTLLAQKDTIIPDMTAAFMNVPIIATVGQGQKLVVDVYIPDGQTAGHTFFLGSNNLGQTAPSYLASSDCGVADPVTYASIGHGTVHLIINVYGDVSAGMEDFSANKFEAWPNPANEVVYVSLPDGKWHVELIGINGQQIMSSELSGNASLETNSLPRGMYLLRASNGTSSLQKKVILH